jgi:hypothetical protein
MRSFNTIFVIAVLALFATLAAASSQPSVEDAFRRRQATRAQIVDGTLKNKRHHPSPKPCAGQSTSLSCPGLSSPIEGECTTSTALVCTYGQRNGGTRTCEYGLTQNYGQLINNKRGCNQYAEYGQKKTCYPACPA